MGEVSSSKGIEDSVSISLLIITEEEDRIPKNLAKVLENPRKYIPGPDSMIVSLN